MAKGQKRNSREAKKPKTAKKPATPVGGQKYQFPGKPAPVKDNGK